MSKSSFFEQIRQVVAQIPEGKVATYGQIARLVNSRDARKVGWALRGNQNPDVPCHRVIRSDGTIAENYSLGNWQEQKRRLLEEGVEFVEERKVDLSKYQWDR